MVIKSSKNLLFIMQDVNNYPPLGIMQLSAIAKQEGYETQLGLLSKEDVLEKIKTSKPSLICYGGTTGEHKYYTEFNQKLKASGASPITLVGGSHATFFPEVIEEGKYDYLIKGEAEIAFRKFIIGLKEGILSKEKVITSDRLVKNLDSLPFPDRELFAEEKVNQGFMMSRGCPYTCSYCFNHSLKEMYKGQKYLRKRSIDNIIEEMKQVKDRYNFKTMKIFDDIITAKVDDWFKEFCERYKKEIGISFWALNRYDLISDEMVVLLKNAGCKALQLSVEAVDDDIRNNLLKRNMSKAQILRGQKICRDNGIKVITNVMIGLPGTSIETDIEAVNFVVDNKFDYVDFPIFQPYPKTELGEKCIAEGLFSGDYNKLDLTYNDESVLNFDAKHKNKLRNLSFLGTIAVLNPKTKDFILKDLIDSPYTDFYLHLYNKYKYEFYNKHFYNQDD